jgi:MoaA/NifB/PqqE/SkfB family radical SAM enzyme
MQEYSPFKLAHHQDKIASFREGKQPIPLQVQLIISDLCNHNCSFCAYRMEGYTSNQNFGVWDPVKNMINNNPNRMIPYEKCIEIIDDCVSMGVKAIQFTGGGEPTVHPNHDTLFKYAIDKGLDLALVSNAGIMREGVPETLSRGKWVRFSVDAGYKETYAKIRRVTESSFTKALWNISKVVNARNVNKDSELIIGIGFVVTKENWNEVYEATRVAKDLGVDNIRISAVFSPEDYEYHKQYYSQCKELILKAKAQFETPTFKVFNLFGDRVDDLIQHKPEYDFCSYMHLNTYIGGDLKVYTCCNNAYNLHGEMGSIKDRSFKDFWLSDEKVKNYFNFKASSCERCMFNNKNRFANYLIEANPKHVNFV